MMLITSFTNATRVRQDALQSVLDPRYMKVWPLLWRVMDFCMEVISKTS